MIRLVNELNVSLLTLGLLVWPVTLVDAQEVRCVDVYGGVPGGQSGKPVSRVQPQYVTGYTNLGNWGQHRPRNVPGLLANGKRKSDWRNRQTVLKVVEDAKKAALNRKQRTARKVAASYVVQKVATYHSVRF